MIMVLFCLFLVCLATCVSDASAYQPEPHARKTFLAVGAHAGDMEITCGAVLSKHSRAGDRVVLLHLTPGERGNPRLTPEQYGAQKKHEAEAAAKDLGAEVMFGAFRDGELPDDEHARRYVADVIRQVRPTYIITHWRHSIHRDHTAAHNVTVDAVLLASLPGVQSAFPAHRGVRRVLFAENWEDREGFSPFVYVDVSDAVEIWKKAATRYEFIRGGISSYPYLEYYKALLKVRGAESGFRFSEAFDIDPIGKKQVFGLLP